MLKNRISLRLATAAGRRRSAAGAAFGFSAFAADTGAAPDQAASAAILPDEADTESFFPDDSQGVPAGRLEQASTEREQALAQSLATASGTLEEEKEEEEEPETVSIPSGDPRAIAQAMLADYGWGSDQFSCLDCLWHGRAAGTRQAANPDSGAYGIPQALPGTKMASAGSDWQTNPATQIKWGLGYIKDRYGSPCAAWGTRRASAGTNGRANAAGLAGGQARTTRTRRWPSAATGTGAATSAGGSSPARRAPRRAAPRSACRCST